MMDYQGGWLPNMPPAIVAVRPAVARRSAAQRRQDELLDDALKETFPASDPISVVRIT